MKKKSKYYLTTEEIQQIIKGQSEESKRKEQKIAYKSNHIENVPKKTINERKEKREQENKKIEHDTWRRVLKKTKPPKSLLEKGIWKYFIMALCAVGIGAGVKIGKDIGKSIKDNLSKNRIEALEVSETSISEYDKKGNYPKPSGELAKKYFTIGRDQEYLNLVSDGTHEGWLSLPESVKRWIRDPEKVAEGQRKMLEDKEKFEKAQAERKTLEFIEKKDIPIIENESSASNQLIENNTTTHNGDVTIEILPDEIVLDDDILITEEDDDILIIEEDDEEPFTVYLEDSTIILPDDEDDERE